MIFAFLTALYLVHCVYELYFLALLSVEVIDMLIM